MLESSFPAASLSSLALEELAEELDELVLDELEEELELEELELAELDRVARRTLRRAGGGAKGGCFVAIRPRRLGANTGDTLHGAVTSTSFFGAKKLGVLALSEVSFWCPFLAILLSGGDSVCSMNRNNIRANQWRNGRVRWCRRRIPIGDVGSVKKVTFVWVRKPSIFFRLPVCAFLYSCVQFAQRQS